MSPSQPSSSSHHRTPSDVRRARNLMRMPQVPRADIARRAYELYLARGATHGHDLDDWLQAERELSLAGR